MHAGIRFVMSAAEAVNDYESMCLQANSSANSVPEFFEWWYYKETHKRNELGDLCGDYYDDGRPDISFDEWINARKIPPVSINGVVYNPQAVMTQRNLLRRKMMLTRKGGGGRVVML